MTLEELKNNWKNRIYKLTEQLFHVSNETYEYRLIQEERETLIKCLEELENIDL